MDLTGASRTKETSKGVTLYPIVSEFGFYVTDFYGAGDKFLDRDCAEGWAGDLIIGGDHARRVISDAPIDALMIPAIPGSRLAGLGCNSVKASTGHFTVMQNMMSGLQFPEGPDAGYPLDDNLILLSVSVAWDGLNIAYLLANPATFSSTDSKNGWCIGHQEPAAAEPKHNRLRHRRWR